MSNVPKNTVYSCSTPQTPNQRTTLTQLRQKHRNLKPITIVTTYNYPSTVYIDMAAIDERSWIDGDRGKLTGNLGEGAKGIDDQQQRKVRSKETKRG
ncbi:hypothetical protein PIB30_064055, partial [Stylosanthes scabra]|nr:hypothetical protein [Stylosanthes scabra]